jgi:hypothetical protein
MEPRAVSADKGACVYESPALYVHGSLRQATKASIFGPEADQTIMNGQGIIGRTSF